MIEEDVREVLKKKYGHILAGSSYDELENDLVALYRYRKATINLVSRLGSIDLPAVHEALSEFRRETWVRDLHYIHSPGKKTT